METMQTTSVAEEGTSTAFLAAALAAAARALLYSAALAFFSAADCGAASTRPSEMTVLPRPCASEGASEREGGEE